MRLIRDLPIRSKLTLLLVVIASVALLLTAVATFINDIRTIRSLMAAQFAMLASVLGANSAAALNFHDQDKAEQVLSSLRREPSVVFACTYDSADKVFATYSASAESVLPPSPLHDDQPLFEGDYLHVYKPILQDDKPLGTVYLRASLANLEAQSRRYAWIVSSALAVSLAVAVLLASGLQRVISRPILQLVEAARTVRANADFSVRVAKQSRDELGMLCDEFNAMLEQVQQRDEELAQHRGQLEALVAQRTRNLQIKTQELARSNLELERSSAELQQFTLVSSHDLQEPLRKVQAFGDLLQTECAEALSDPGKDYLNRMRKSAARARELIDALLIYSRIASQPQPFAAVELPAVAQAVVADLEARIRELGGRVEIGELPTLVADRAQMRQLFCHLIDNGLKFHRPDVPPVVTITSHEDQVCLDAASQGAPGNHWFMITFQDNGIGFDEKYAERIFAPYERLVTRESNAGTGMGLAICRRIVQRHGGKIIAHSEPERGATLIVMLPARPISPLETRGPTS